MVGTATARRITPADEKIAKAIGDGRSFLLDAGAGSGKTASLVRALTLLRREYRDTLLAKRQQVACITYTNVAKDEIVERTEHDGLLRVSTIHDFLWNIIRSYQNDLKRAVVAFNSQLPMESSRKKDAGELDAALNIIEKVVYSERGSNFLEGRIHHDDLIGIAKLMFQRHVALSRITGARFPYIFVDEYQDTFPEVVEILMDYVLVNAPQTIVGFFGDKAQAIYDDVVGELSESHRQRLERIAKEENYRCPISVIDLLNRFRMDIQQTPAGNNVPGATVFVGFQKGQGSVEKGYELALPRLVDGPALNKTKILYLTHRLIARKAGYGDLFAVYNAHGGHIFNQFKSGEEPIIRFLAHTVDHLADDWSQGNVGSVLSLIQKNSFEWISIKQKKTVASALERLTEMISNDASIGRIVENISAEHLVELIDDLVEGMALIAKSESPVDGNELRRYKLMSSLLGVPFKQVRLYREVMNNNLPYSTKHGVKGDEFDTVIVVLDDSGANWNNYSFGKMLSETDDNSERLERTRNLFYVSCSRARLNLVVVDMNYSGGRKSGVERLFGNGNIIIA